MKKTLIMLMILMTMIVTACTNAAINNVEINENVVNATFESNKSNELNDLGISQEQKEYGQVTREELSAHNSLDDCWVLYKGVVYDITGFLPEHPGSAAAITPYCGTMQFENAFSGQHGTSKVSKMMSVATIIGNFE